MDKQTERVLQQLYDAKDTGNHLMAFCTTLKPVEHYLGPDSGKVVPVGTTLKIVMVSRMGDIGLTTNLQAERGYTIRLAPENGELGDFRLNIDGDPDPEEPEDAG